MKDTKETSTLTKEKIAEQLKKHFGLSSLICEEITESVFFELLWLAKDSEKVMLQNFGTWKVNHKKARPGFNITAKRAVDIEARNVLRFIPSRPLRKKINDSNLS
jgi:nucleoid DNA-binding protein